MFKENKLKLYMSVFLLVGVCFANIFTSYYNIVVERYGIFEKKLEKKTRIILLSDLHDHEFGSSNSKLVSAVKENSPDLIILDGDMLNADSENSKVATNLVEQLSDIAPVYYSLGNHEYDYMAVGASDLLAEIEIAGAKILNHKIYDIKVNGNKLRLGGLYEYGFETSMQTDEENKKVIPYLKEFTNTDRYTIMCAHRPESFYCWNYVDKWGIDLQLSGHLHGGQVIIPFVGGLYSNLEGFFPKYDYGEYEIGDSTMIITRGLSSNPKILPRFNNPPEIVVVDLLPEK